MNFGIKLTFTLLLICSQINYSYAYNFQIPIEVVQVYDGDTIEAKIDQNYFKIRLHGIDCMETSAIHRAYMQAYKNNLNIDKVIEKGNLAKVYLEKKINKSKKDFLFEFKGIDKYGRAIGIFYIENDNINNELLNKNLCLPYIFEKH